MKTTLLIMAAGIGSRFGEGIKQLAAVDDGGHIIMDYSIHDAIKAGFNKVVFIIRKDIEKDFKEAIGDRIEKDCSSKGIEFGYCFQDINAIPAGESVPAERKKPWGTGQAVLAAKDLVKEPFVVINADDYYGKEAFVKIHEWLLEEHSDNEYCMAGFILKNTLSENGGVTRGVCQVSEDKYLQDIVETSDIVKTANGAAVGDKEISPESYVSMNMWGMNPTFMDTLDSGFADFFKTKVVENPLKAEYLVPTIVGDMLAEGKVTVKVLPTNDKWFGVTYAEDKPLVVESFKALIEKGEYDKELYKDI